MLWPPRISRQPTLNAARHGSSPGAGYRCSLDTKHHFHPFILHASSHPCIHPPLLFCSSPCVHMLPSGLGPHSCAQAKSYKSRQRAMQQAGCSQWCCSPGTGTHAPSCPAPWGWASCSHAACSGQKGGNKNIRSSPCVCGRGMKGPLLGHSSPVPGRVQAVAFIFPF